MNAATQAVKDKLAGLDPEDMLLVAALLAALAVADRSWRGDWLEEKRRLLRDMEESETRHAIAGLEASWSTGE